MLWLTLMTYDQQNSTEGEPEPMQGIINFFVGILTLGGQFDWGLVKQYLFDSSILSGAIITVILAIISQITGSFIGLLLYLLRRSQFRVVRGIAELYIWFFRGTPLLVQLLLLISLFPYLHLVRVIRAHDFFPALGFQYVALEVFLPAFIAFSLNEGAYMSEIVRAGIDSIDTGQMEAAKSLGMTFGQAMRRIILPQAVRVILPPLGNEFNSMLKNTSIAGTFALTELYLAASNLGSSFFKPLEFGIVAAFWYLVMTTLWGFVQSWLERRFNASNLDGPKNTSFIDRLLGRGNKPVTPDALTKDIALTSGRR